jgi:lipopolysaccharide biosynthesis protein
MRIAVLTHLFYHDLWDDLAAYITHICFPFDLYVNLVEGNPANGPMAKTIRHRFPGAHVQVTENRGRDIGGFLRLTAAVLQGGRPYSSVILMHSKKSLRKPPGHGSEWLHTLLNCLLGHPERVKEIMLAFLIEPCLGMVGSDVWLFNEQIRPELAFSKNRPFVEEYRRRFNLPYAATDFIAGTMFWVRAEPFLGFFAQHDPLAIAAELETGDHYDEDQPTRTHALERIFGYLVTSQGYIIRGLKSCPQLTDSQASELSTPSRA